MPASPYVQLPTDPREVEASRAFARAVRDTKLAGTYNAYPCESCGRHAFPEPGTVCYWCRRSPTNDT